MKGLVWGLVFVFAVLIGGIGIFLLMNRPLGVAVNCSGDIEGFGSPSFPLSSYESECRAEVRVSQDNKTVCRGEGSVKGSESVISCSGLKTGNMRKPFDIEASFYDESGNYANASGKFRTS